MQLMGALGFGGKCVGHRAPLSGPPKQPNYHPIDAVNLFKETVNEVDSTLLAVEGDVDTGILLFMQPNKSCIAFGLSQLVSVDTLFRLKYFRFRNPAWLRQAPSHGSGKELVRSHMPSPR